MNQKGLLWIISGIIVTSIVVAFLYQPKSSTTITDDTLITNKNINEVMTILGLELGNIGEKDYSREAPNNMTVGELRKIIKITEYDQPMEVTDGDSYSFLNDININGLGEVSCYRPIPHDGFTLLVQADGEYYNNEQAKERYFTKGKQGALHIENSEQKTYYYNFTTPPSVQIDVVRRQSPGSYLVVTYSANIGKYKTKNKALKDSIPIDGKEIFYIQDILK